MRKLKIALLQIAPTGSLAGNLEKGIAACRSAREMGADIALFPEMWSNGYNIYDRPVSEWVQEAISADGDFVQGFGKLAAELDMAIGITLLEAYCREEEATGENNRENLHPEAPRNTLVLFDRKGRRVLTYAKVHTCDFDVERNLTPGEDFYVVDLDTGLGTIKVGAMICYDREFPESARILMLKGAEVVLVPNACPMEINRLAQLRGRAFENMMAIATCNYPETVPDCNGHSNAFDGVAYLPELPDSRDTCVLEADGSEGIFVVNFDIDMIRAYRSAEMHGNTFRRPKKYGLLVEEGVKEPFIRDGYRGRIMENNWIIGAKGNTALRRMRNEEKDMELLLKWLTNPQVIRYVYEEGVPWTSEKIHEEFAEKMTEEGTTTACLILYEDREVGYLQYYPIEENSYKFNDLATYEKIKGGYGVDMFIGEPELWQKGIGRRVLSILEEYLKGQLKVSVICADPATDNERGMNFWPKVGFVPVDTIESYDDCSKQSVLMVKKF